MNRLSSIPHPPSVTSLLASAFSALLAPVQNLLPEHVNRPQINALDIRTLFSLHLPPSAARRGWPLSVCKISLNPTQHYFSETFYRQWWLKALVKGIPDHTTTQTPQVKGRFIRDSQLRLAVTVPYTNSGFFSELCLHQSQRVINFPVHVLNQKHEHLARKN